MTKIASEAGSKRRREDDVQGPPRKIRRSSNSATPDAEGSAAVNSSAKPSTKHSKKERKQNRSTRIHSLRKQLSRSTLPSNIRQERERELAALEYDQGKDKDKKQARKTLEKYHYVRFVERMKAEKKLKQLRKLKTKEKDENARVKLDEDIHEMEVCRNYAIYAPLGQKYVSVFAKSDSTSAQEEMPPKPAMWHTVEKVMRKDQSALEALRDGTKTSKIVDNEIRGSSLANAEKSSKNRRNMFEPGETISTGQRHDRKDPQLEASDGEMSDGGFFEK